MKIIMYFILFFVFYSVDSQSASIKKIDSLILTKQIHDFLKKENIFNNKDDIEIKIRTPLNKNMKYCEKPIFSLLRKIHTLGLIDLLLICNQSKYYLTLEIQSIGEYVVSNKYIPHGMQIREADLTILIGRLDILPNNTYRKKKDVIGKVNIRDFFPLQTITSFMTRPIWLVKVNQEVKIIIKDNNFKITSKAKSLNNGARNDKIRVKMNTGKIINGTVNQKGEVIISL